MDGSLFNRGIFFTFAPDELGGGGGQVQGGAAGGGNEGTPPSAPPSPSTPTTPAPTPSTQPSGGGIQLSGTPYPADASAAAPTAPGVPPPTETTSAGAPATQGAPAQPNQWTSARDYARSLGIDPAGAEDDAAFLRNIFSQAQRAEANQQQLQFLAQQNAALLRAQQGQPQPGAAAPAQSAKPKHWNPPEWNPSWEGLISRDEKGNLGVVAGADPSILSKYMAYQQYRREFADRLVSDPMATLAPFIDERAEQRAQALVNQHLQGYRDQVFSDNYVSENSSWLHARDANNNLLMNPVSNKPQLSPAGQRFYQYVQQAEQIGIRDVRNQAEYARTSLQRDVLISQQNAATGVNQGQNANQALIQAANRNPNMSGSLAPAATPTAPMPPQNPGLSLREQLAQAMASQGFNDNTHLAL